MGLFDRISRLFRANVNSAISAAENPEKILEQAVIDMQSKLVDLRQAVAKAIAAQKRAEQQYQKAQAEADNWQQRAQLALTKGDEALAAEALKRKKPLASAAASYKQQAEQQANMVAGLKKNLTNLEAKISEAKVKKDMLKARAGAAKANEQLTKELSGLSTEGSMAAFDRMEEKVLEMEARGQASAELAGSDLESQFMELEGGDVDDELAALKAQMSGGALPAASEEPLSLPAKEEKEPVDAELDKLRDELNGL